ncbi:MAG: hypothetical protein IJB31_04215 [Akkermansia sp.]|nr:hypothetical protein [Akkermansia sp.]
MRSLPTLLLLFCLVQMIFSAGAMVPTHCTQAIVGITEGWNSSHVTLSLLEKQADGRWARVMGPIPGRLGRNGCVWGLGVHSNPRKATIKKEGDGRSPAGIFALGGLWVTNKHAVQHHKNIPLVKVGPKDLWVSDINTPHLYNRYVRLKHPARTEWELREQMRQTDYAHSIKLLICHNTWETAGRPIPGAGSSIFFHIWRRGGAAPTAGCTSMDESNLRAMIARLNPHRHPVYILLPRQEYAKWRKSWHLP